MNVEFLHTRLSLRLRFVIAFFFYAVAALLQVLFVQGEGFPLTIFRFAALLLLVVPLWFLKVHSFPDKAKVRGGSKQEGIWRTVGITELDRFRNRINTIRKAKIPGIYNQSIGIVFAFLFIFLLVPAGAIGGAVGFFTILDLYLIFFPVLWFARVEKKYPAIRGKLAVFDPMLNAELPKELRMDPMLLFDGGEQTGAGQIRGGQALSDPGDMRLMLVPGAGAAGEIRDELIGAQFQITWNNGPNGVVPYMYVVFITKGQGRIWQTLKNVSASGYVTETGSSAEGDTVYGTVVLRQRTPTDRDNPKGAAPSGAGSRSDGYHTRESDVRELLDLTVDALKEIL